MNGDQRTTGAFANDDEQTKNVFAHFGLAFYLSCVFETTIVQTLLSLEFFRAKKEELHRLGLETFNQTQFEMEFDAFLQSQYCKTLGNLLRRFYESTETDDAIKTTLKRAKERRDILAHHFFREHAENFARRKGREKMLSELQADQELFETAERELAAHMVPIMKALGIPLGAVDARIRRYMASAVIGET